MIYYQRPTFTLLQGDVRECLQSLPADSVHCVVTSPPYWGLRSYGTDPQVWPDGRELCETHEWGDAQYQRRSNDSGKGDKQETNVGANQRDEPIHYATCARCGAWRGELGLEPTPALFVRHIVEIFREVKRVLRPDGVCFVNLGDSYASGQKGSGGPSEKQESNKGAWYNKQTYDLSGAGLKPKDLCGIPWRVAFALQDDGWWLRQDIIWSKPNPMPESVTDRCTKSHEYIFLLTKSARYFWDATAVMEGRETNDDYKYRNGKAYLNQQGAQDNSSSSHNAARGAFGASLSSPALRPEITTTLSTNDGTVNSRGWCDFGQSKVSINGTVARDTKRLQVINLVGFKIGIVTPKGNYVVNLQDSIGDAATAASESIASQCESALRGPIRAFVTNLPASPCGAVLASHIDANPITGALAGAEVTAMEVVLISENILAARIALNQDGFSFTLYIWDTLASTHLAPLAYQDTKSITQDNVSGKRNLRSVWSIPTQPFADAHFATYPQELVERCIKAGTSERGCCPVCGAPWVRVVEKSGASHAAETESAYEKGSAANRLALARQAARNNGGEYQNQTTTVGWRATCGCDRPDVTPCVVLDPFLGSGTTALVANRMGRKAIGVELKPEYAEMAVKRLQQEALL